MERKITRKDIPTDVIWIPNEVELPFERLWASNCGVYGWNYSLYRFGYVTIGKGYRIPKNIGYDGRDYISVIPTPDDYLYYRDYLQTCDIAVKLIHSAIIK